MTTAREVAIALLKTGSNEFPGSSESSGLSKRHRGALIGALAGVPLGAVLAGAGTPGAGVTMPVLGGLAGGMTGSLAGMLSADPKETRQQVTSRPSYLKGWRYGAAAGGAGGLALALLRAARHGRRPALADLSSSILGGAGSGSWIGSLGGGLRGIHAGENEEYVGDALSSTLLGGVTGGGIGFLSGAHPRLVNRTKGFAPVFGAGAGVLAGGAVGYGVNKLHQIREDARRKKGMLG